MNECGSAAAGVFVATLSRAGLQLGWLSGGAGVPQGELSGVCLQPGIRALVIIQPEINM